MNLREGAILQGGKYRIERELGHGGFGITYLATQVGLNRRVAIKEFFMSEYCNRDADTSHVSVPSEGSKELVAKFRSKFIKEAQTIAEMDNHHIIRIHDVFEDNGTAYYVMEYLDRGSLADLVKRHGRLSEADALRYTRQIADALRYIHERKMNHLDVKPGNILIDETDHAVLIDFGLSKRYDDEGKQTSTTPVGISHGYAPLEQYKKSGVGTFSPATDIYSLGATLYKLVTGTTPPDANDVNDDGLPSFPAYVSATTAKTIEQAMQPRRKDRPQTVEAFLALLDAEIDVKDAKDDEVTVIEPRQEKEPDAVAKQQDASTTEDKGSILLGCIVILFGLVAICGLGYWGVKSFKEHRAEKAHMAYVEQQRLDSIARETARLEQIAQHRKDSLEAVAAEEAERKRVEEAKRLEQQRKAEEAKRLEQQRKAEEAKRLEQQRKAEEAKRLEQQRKAEEEKENLQEISQPYQVKEEDDIFQVVDNQPEFPGGTAELMKFLQKNIKYPSICKEQGIQGRVVVQFVVNTDGSIVNPMIIKSVDPHLDAEALRVVSIMPKWKPGEQRGKIVHVRYTLPISFRLT